MFERRGDGLLCNLTISLLDALVGFQREARRGPGWSRALLLLCAAVGVWVAQMMQPAASSPAAALTASPPLTPPTTHSSKTWHPAD